jgi:hypothetical protein
MLIKILITQFVVNLFVIIPLTKKSHYEKIISIDADSGFVIDRELQ